jgi:hypothetical protein
VDPLPAMKLTVVEKLCSRTDVDARSIGEMVGIWARGVPFGMDVRG